MYWRRIAAITQIEWQIHFSRLGEFVGIMETVRAMQGGVGTPPSDLVWILDLFVPESCQGCTVDR